DGRNKAELLRDWLRGANQPRNVVLTCRLHDYVGDLVLDLPAALVEELDEVRIRRFATNYLGEDAGLFLQRIIPVSGRISDDRHLSHLARNPSLLAALMLVYKGSPAGDLPHNQGALFQRLTRVLWERERQRRTPGWRPFEEMQAAFSRLGFAMIDEG